MRQMRMSGWLIFWFCVFLGGNSGLTANEKIDIAQKVANNGNYKDALPLFAAAIDSADALTLAGITDALSGQTNSYLMLNQPDAAAAALEQNAQKFSGDTNDSSAPSAANWRGLYAAAISYGRLPKFGSLLNDRFTRNYDMNGERMMAMARDRSQILQWLARAQSLLENDTTAVDAEKFQFYQGFADQISNNNEWWKLQFLTDFAQLADYEAPNDYHFRRATSGAPVNADGDPLLYEIPATFAAARNDGERWRWLLAQMDKFAAPAERVAATQRMLAFSIENFGLQTLADSLSNPDVITKFFSGVMALDSLSDNESIAKLASGIRRFSLPDDYAPQKLRKKIFQLVEGKNAKLAIARTIIAEYCERRQYENAERWLRQIYGFDPSQFSGDLAQITGKWARFEAAATDEVRLVYRNAQKISFTAYRIKVEDLLHDAMEELRSKTPNLSHFDVNNIGERLVFRGETVYLTDRAAAWEMKLPVPEKKYADASVNIKLPPELSSGGYLVEAKIEGGNTARIVIWRESIALVQKRLDRQILFYAADAQTGAPLPNLTITAWGYRNVWRNRQLENKFQEKTLTKTTNENGCVTFSADEIKDYDQGYNWLFTAKKNDQLAYYGFVPLWIESYRDDTSDRDDRHKNFVITDRPIYRPGDAVRIKIWSRLASYDLAENSTAEPQHIYARIFAPNGDKNAEQTVATVDNFGGAEWEFTIPRDAQLGRWQIVTPYSGSAWFRVEEYKKPEFEIQVDTPAEPVALGDKITATVKAKYYFGEPVKNGMVKYRVMRQSVNAQWLPPQNWDWLYGNGFWWFGGGAWLPQARAWLPLPPIFRWQRDYQRSTPPELITEQTAALDANGELKITLDTAAAKLLHPDLDHRYNFSVQVTDQSRRTIDGSGAVLVAKEPFTITAWSDNGFYEMPAKIKLRFHAQTLNQKPARGIGVLKISKIAYRDQKMTETQIKEISRDQNENGEMEYDFIPDEPGQYLAAYTITTGENAAKIAITGATVFTVRGSEKFAQKYSPLEIIPERQTYSVGERCRLQISADYPNATVLLFLRGVNGVNKMPRILRLANYSEVFDFVIEEADQPNIFVEALTLYRGKIYNEIRQIAVPPQKRILNVEVQPEKSKLTPGEKSRIAIRLTDRHGRPYQGQAVLTIYDKSVEYISGGSNVPEIKQFFWSWLRQHYVYLASNLYHQTYNLLKKNETAMQTLSRFEELARELTNNNRNSDDNKFDQGAQYRLAHRGKAAMPMMTAGRFETNAVADSAVMEEAPTNAAPGLGAADEAGNDDSVMDNVAVRENFADTAVWQGAILTDNNGDAMVDFAIPESLTAWKIRVWAMGDGAAVGENSAEIVTFKDLLLRLQIPRFLVVGDTALVSANLHNYSESAAKVKTVMTLAGEGVKIIGNNAPQISEITANDEARVEWVVEATGEGKVEIVVKTLADDKRSDAMKLAIPIIVHGIDKTVAFSGALRPEQPNAAVMLEIPAARRLDTTKLQIRYSPSLALAMLDALPYFAEYPYGCTEQTLNKFLPLVIAQNVLKKTGVKLDEIKKQQINFNAQELGNPAERAAQWQKQRKLSYDPVNEQMIPFAPVFDEQLIAAMCEYGVKRLTAMQCADGGWGWFSGYGERSFPHTTALVVRGLLIARDNGALIPGNIIQRGVDWLQRYQSAEVAKLRAGVEREKAVLDNHDLTATDLAKKFNDYKTVADNLDALVFSGLAQAEITGESMVAMFGFLARDRAQLTPYGKALFGIGLANCAHGATDALAKAHYQEQLKEVLNNLAQFVVEDNENQTARLNLGADNVWWYWYGSPIETAAMYLKLLAQTDPQNPLAAALAKYLINNRKNATYWESTRDSALAIEALSDFVIYSGEDTPEMTLDILLGGRVLKTVAINRDNLFTFADRVELKGQEIPTGRHKLEIKRRGKGAVYFNAYLSYFSLEDQIKAAGLEIKTVRKVYRLISEKSSAPTADSSGNALMQAQQKYHREELANGSPINSGDLLEVELQITAKNDYEYLIFRDYKIAGAEPIGAQSGYIGGGYYPIQPLMFGRNNGVSADAAGDERNAASFSSLPTYLEYRDTTVNFFARQLPRGTNTVRYRLRAVYPGSYSALPTVAEAMYAPELRANADEIKLKIKDAERK